MRMQSGLGGRECSETSYQIHSLELDSKSMTLKGPFTVQDAARYSGLPLTMVDYLCRNKVLAPSTEFRRGRGRPRRYSFGDIVMLRALAKLLRNGISVLRLGKALAAL